MARYEQAVASLEQVDAQSASTEAQIAQAKAGLQQVEADLDRAQVNLEYANIFSPVDGIVVSRDVDVGQTIAASMSAPTLFNIATDLSQMQVKASVDEADIGSISEDAKVTFTVDAYPNTVFEGRIAEIRLNPQTVQNVVTYSVILSIQNKDLRLKPGMTASIKIMVAERENALKVPNAAIRYHLPGTPAPSFGATVESMTIVPRRSRSPVRAFLFPRHRARSGILEKSCALPLLTRFKTIQEGFSSSELTGSPSKKASCLGFPMVP